MQAQINRYNYEEFFLLYVDGELSAADKQAVELFVQEHTDLADELAIYQQMRLPADDMNIMDKTLLYRFESGDINADNHEEYFHLYVDNELDAVTKEKVEVFVLQHPAYQEAFTLLKQTRLPLETIVFADKSALYRKEEKKPFVYLYWGRMAVAAVVPGLIVLTGVIFTGNNAGEQNVAKLVTPANSANQKSTEPGVSQQLAKSNSLIAIQQTGKQTNNLLQNNAAIINNGVITTTSNDNLLAANTNNTSSILPVENSSQTNVAATEEKATITDKVSADNNSLANTDIIKTLVPVEEENVSANPIAQTVAYKELDTDDEKKSLYLGSLEINKDKLRGFFRKAGSIFRSKARQEEDSKTESTPRNLK